jgi:pimeloyl-ACP methyl ester carboxylesterase
LYARSRDVRIAYQVTGAGPDLVVVPGLTSHLEIQWKDLSYRRFMRSLSSFCRVVRFDKRGTGLSDPVLEPPSRDGRISDLRAVISASKCHRPILFGFSDGGHIAIVMAASHARSVRGLILYGTSPRHPPEWAQRQLRADSAQILTERVPPHPRKKRSIWFKFDCVLRLGPIGQVTHSQRRQSCLSCALWRPSVQASAGEILDHLLVSHWLLVIGEMPAIIHYGVF